MAGNPVPDNAPKMTKSQHNQMVYLITWFLGALCRWIIFEKGIGRQIKHQNAKCG
jgi:hypothetical protein